MNIIVCVKEIIDPEITPGEFKIDPLKNVVVAQEGLARVLNPFDEQAVEAALRIKDTSDCKITILALGKKLRRQIIKKPLGMGADELILLEDDSFDGGDSWSTAHALAKAIEKIGIFDLVFCGRQAGDWDSGQVGLGIAEMLGIPSVTVARKIEVLNGKVRVERVAGDLCEIIEVVLPALITVSNELGSPRLPDIPKILKAAKKQPTIWKPQDIKIDAAKAGESGRRVKLLKLFQPIREDKCEIIGGETLEEAAINLAQKLRNEKVI